MRTRFLALAAAAPLLLGVVSSAGVAAASPAAPAASVAAAAASHARPVAGPCGTVTSAPRHKHVIWIWMENHSYNTIIGSVQAPYLNELATECGLATNYHNVTHPSLPNYIAATSGLGYAGIKKFTPDCNLTPGCTTSARSIFAQGETWKAYEVSMPSDCHKANSGNYAVRHNPPAYYTSLRGCSKNDVPYSHLAGDLKNNRLPAFSFITPDLIDDMHNGTIADGDNWLSANLPVILSSREYKSGSTVVMITWDEGEGGTATKCATNTTDVGCHVAAIVISPSTKVGFESDKLFNHYSLLATAEQLLHLTKLGLAAKATTLTKAFNL